MKSIAGSIARCGKSDEQDFDQGGGLFGWELSKPDRQVSLPFIFRSSSLAAFISAKAALASCGTPNKWPSSFSAFNPPPDRTSCNAAITEADLAVMTAVLDSNRPVDDVRGDLGIDALEMCKK
jgi:hypothetical protein